MVKKPCILAFLGCFFGNNVKFGVKEAGLGAQSVNLLCQEMVFLVWKMTFPSKERYLIEEVLGRVETATFFFFFSPEYSIVKINIFFSGGEIASFGSNGEKKRTFRAKISQKKDFVVKNGEGFEFF